MKVRFFAPLLFSLFAGLFSPAWAAFRVEPAHEIEIIGNKFFNSSSGTQFFIRGIAYQRSRKPGEIYDAETETAYVDSLATPALCLKDLELLRELGINTVRVYQVDPSKNHDVCMNAFANHGIYVLVDLSEPQRSITQSLPSWDIDLLKRYTDVVDSMSTYTNLLGFIAGNEVLNKVQNSDAAAFVKASVRDVKAYIRKKNYRLIPVGYASADDTITRLDSASYFNCRDNSTGTDNATDNATATATANALSTVDFYALNMFEWCGYSSYGTSGYKERTVEFSQLPVPVFFSEYGCNAVRPRPFTEIDLIYGPTMLQVWSGAVLYEFFQNENRFGLVDENSVGHIIKLEDFNIVKLRLVESVARPIHKDASPAAYPYDYACPSVSGLWNALHVLPPTPDPELCDCLQASLSCVVTPYVRVNEHELLLQVCEKTSCHEVMADGSRGSYGRFSACSMKQRASYALNKYYLEKNRRLEYCDFGKRAALTTTFGALGFHKARMSDGRMCDEVLRLMKPDEPKAVPKPSKAPGDQKAGGSGGSGSSGGSGGAGGFTQKGGASGELNSPKNAGSSQDVGLEFENDLNGAASHSAAQRLAVWGCFVVGVFVVSFMYLAT